MLEAAVFLFVAMTALWAPSVRLKDSSIVDIFWGLAFVGITAIEWWLAPADPRRTLLLALVTLWGVRLSVYLYWRNHGKPEDARYTAMRQQHGEKWPMRSLFIVFYLQGVLAFVVSAPVQAVMTWPGPSLGMLDVVGAGVCLAGVAFEGIGDLQLARFKRHHKGEVMDQGLWRYTRHPNYFGDFLVWWGLFLIAASTGFGALAFFGPLVMSVLLMRVSGVTLLEKSMGKRPGYADYIRRTSAFFPRPPKKA